jgi:predicted phage-related endonuclease
MSISEDHLTGIGASQIAALPPFACSEFMTEYDVIAGKLSLLPPRPQTINMLLGKLLEDDLAEAYQFNTGRAVRLEGSKLYRHDKYECLICHPDGWTVAEDGSEYGIEFKIAGFHQLTHWGAGDEQVPLGYYLQAQHNMLVTGIPAWDLVVLLGTDLRIYPIKENRKIQTQIVVSARTAWGKIGQLKKALAAEGSEKEAAVKFLADLAGSCEEKKKHMLIKVYSQIKGDRGIVPPEHHWLASQAILTYGNFKAEEANLEDLKNRIRLALQEGKGWRVDGGIIERRGRALFIIPDKEHAT